MIDNSLMRYKNEKNFGLLWGSITLFFTLIKPFFIDHTTVLWGETSLGVILLLAAFFIPKLLKYPTMLWMKLGYFLGWLNTALFFSAIYFSFFTFIRIVFLIIRRDRLLSKWKKYPSTFKTKKIISSFEDPF